MIARVRSWTSLKKDFEILCPLKNSGRTGKKVAKKTNMVRSVVEGTISQAAFALGLGCTRYYSLAKTHLQYVATAAAINLQRAVDRSSQSTFRDSVCHFAAVAASSTSGNPSIGGSHQVVSYALPY